MHARHCSLHTKDKEHKKDRVIYQYLCDSMSIYWVDNRKQIFDSSIKRELVYIKWIPVYLRAWECTQPDQCVHGQADLEDGNDTQRVI